MTANELRIGNLVEKHTNFEPEQWEVYRIFASDLCNNPTHLAKMFRGIPLTPEWLERCPQFKESEVDDRRKGKVYQSFESGPVYFMIVDGVMHFNLIGQSWDTPEFVHTLQNLIFALEHKELTFTE